MGDIDRKRTYKLVAVMQLYIVKLREAFGKFVSSALPQSARSRADVTELPDYCPLRQCGVCAVRRSCLMIMHWPWLAGGGQARRLISFGSERVRLGRAAMQLV